MRVSSGSYMKRRRTPRRPSINVATILKQQGDNIGGIMIFAATERNRVKRDSFVQVYHVDIGTSIYEEANAVCPPVSRSRVNGGAPNTIQSVNFKSEIEQNLNDPGIS